MCGGMRHPALRSPGRLRPPGIGCTPTVDRRGGFHIRPGAFAAARGFAGRCEHRPLHGVRQRGGCGRPQGFPRSVGAGFIPPAGPCAAANRADIESAPTWVRVVQGLRQFCLPCQREVARPQAVTEGLPYGGLTLLSSGILRRGNPPVRGLRRGQPPLTRGPIGSVRRDGASRPTVARAVAAAPDGPKHKIYS